MEVEITVAGGDVGQEEDKVDTHIIISSYYDTCKTLKKLKQWKQAF